MKIHHLQKLPRLWIFAAAMALGILAGNIVGHGSILLTTGPRLSAYADQILQHEEEITAETIAITDQAHTSPYPPCSPEDIALLRRLTFSARFLKDVGRIDTHSFFCSATTGKLPKPVPLLTPDFTLGSNIRIYKNYPLVVPAGDHGEISSNGNSDVVIAPDNFSGFPQKPVHYTVGVAGPSLQNPARKTFLTTVAKAEPVPPGVLESRNTVYAAGILFRARCSHQYAVCAVADISLGELWQENRLLLDGYMIAGGAAGISCATVLLTMGRKRRSHTNQLKRAILMDKLSVVYQPIVELSTHRIVGAEALARWIDEDGESIRPETIIQLAEAEGFVSEITRFILTRALEEVSSVFANNPSFQLSINLAPSDLADPRLLLLLDERIDGTIVRPANVAFELSERATSDRETAIASIRRLRERGHATYIDEFGTGYSNLAYLTELHVDGIKINRSFISTIGAGDITASIVPQILAVAKALNLTVVVQGIEREDQAAYFATNDARILGQGWFFGLPVSAKGLIYLCAEKTA